MITVRQSGKPTQKITQHPMNLGEHAGKTIRRFPYRMEAEQWQQEQPMKGETARRNQMEQPGKGGGS